MEINITALAATITALGVVFGAVFGIYRWFLKQEKQDRDIKSIKEDHHTVTFLTEHPDIDAWSEISALVKGRIRFVTGAEPSVRLMLRPDEDMLGIIHKIFEKYLAFTHN